MPHTLRLILGDQLNINHSWFAHTDSQIWYALFEMRQETDYATHHIQKVTAFFASMRVFAETLRAKGHQVIYYSIHHPENEHVLTLNLNKIIEQKKINHFEYQEPDEYRLDEQLKHYCQSLHIPSACVDTQHFLSTRKDVETLFEGKKQILMETFYRNMRKRYNLLMEANKPVGGKWNYDAENRNKWKGNPPVPSYDTVCNDVSEIHNEIKQAQIKTIGTIQPTQFIWPVSREQALQLLQEFTKHALPFFGQYQDAMATHTPFLFHSRLSFALNVKLISPLEVAHSAISAWQNSPERISLSQVEGFVRQIIGWREYMRGIYWWKMPMYASMNYFKHDRALPEFYWDAKTKMHCMHQSISQSVEHAYAHHIQRLMVTGNFALLAGIHPDEVDAWYLGIYIDAIQWVEITNTRGMSQFADGGIVGSKPYVSSANYIDKMSNYCKDCYYDKSKKYGDRACPFNSLYWHFYATNRDKLAANQRVGMMYNVWDKMPQDEQQFILQQAQQYLSELNEL